MFPADPASIGSPTPAPAEPPSAARALTERQLAMLSELAEIGMEIARAAGRAATTAAAPGEAEGEAVRGDPALAYTRAARAVRLTLALQAQLLKDLAELDTAEAKLTYSRTVQRRMRLVRLVSDGLQVEHDLDARAVGRFADDVRERLREADEDERLLGLPFAEAVAQICADLQLSPERTAQVMAAAELGSPPVTTGGGPAESREGGVCAVTAGRDAPAAPSTTFGGPPPPLHGGGSSAPFLEWPPPSG